MSRKIDISGKSFNRLKVIEYAGVDSRQESMWKCLCDCGTVVEVRSSSLRTGVYFREDRPNTPWQASISVEGKLIALGAFDSYEEACKIREEAELKYYGFNKE